MSFCDNDVVKTKIISLSAAIALGACAAVPSAAPEPSAPTLSWANLGETVYVDGPKVTPLAVLEDSRCPQNAQCVWAGRLRISTRIHLGNGDQTRELTLGEAVSVADGSLELVAARPVPNSEAAIPAGHYRFGLRFMGGL